MFSVIMPVYNGEKFIENAVNSVIGQSFTQWELIIVNDGSTDNTLNVLRAFSDNPQIKVISQSNGGVADARNTGMKNASYDYFAFLDCDDIWYPEHLATLKELIDRYPDGGTFATLGLIRLANGQEVSNIDFFENGGYGNTAYIEDFFSEYDRDKKAKTHYVSCACLSRAAAGRAGEFKKGCKIGEDLAFFLIASIYYPVVLSRKVTAVYEMGNSVTTKDVSFDPDWYFFDEVKEILKDNTIPEKTKNSIKSVMQWFTMRRCRHYIIDGRKKEAWKSYFEIGKNTKLLKDKLITFVLLLMPSCMVRRIFKIRWRCIG